MKTQDEKIFHKFKTVKALSEHLGYSYQRVANWKRRGIPPKIILERNLLNLVDERQE